MMSEGTAKIKGEKWSKGEMNQIAVLRKKIRLLTTLVVVSVCFSVFNLVWFLIATGSFSIESRSPEIEIESLKKPYDLTTTGSGWSSKTSAIVGKLKPKEEEINDSSNEGEVKGSNDVVKRP